MFNKEKIKRFLCMDRNEYKTKFSKPSRPPTKLIESRPVKALPEPREKEISVKKSLKSQKKDYKKEFSKTFSKLVSKYNKFVVWDDFVTMFACSISNSVDKEYWNRREHLYLNRIQKYKNLDERQLFPELAALTTLALEENSKQDFLGEMYMSLGLGNKKNGQFFTPYHIAELMSAVTIDDVNKEISEKGYISIHDPCCGAGVMLIGAINKVKEQLSKENINFQNRILVTGQDIDQTVALMCYIQISLLGVAGYVKVGNSLSDPMCSADSTENYWFTPMYFSDVWVYRRMFKKIDEITKGVNKDDKL